MKKIFCNSHQIKCVFTEEGVAFCGKNQEVFFPYGSLDGIRMSLMGVVQAASGSRFSSFAVDRKDRAAVKEMVQYAHKAMETAPKAESRVTDLSAVAGRVSADLPAEEQMKQYKQLFVQGVITKDELDACKRQLKA